MPRSRKAHTILYVATVVACGAPQQVALMAAVPVRFSETKVGSAPGPESARPTELAEQVSLSGYSLVFERATLDPRRPTLVDTPIEIKDGKVAALSFGRRVIVGGASALIVDRQENPMFTQYSMVPDYAGGGFMLVSPKGLFHARTFEGIATPLSLPKSMLEPEGLSLLFGPNAVLVQDSRTLGGDDQDDLPEGKLYLSLRDAKPRAMPVPNVRQLAGTMDGRLAAMNRDGDLFYAEAEDKPLRKLDLPRARSFESTGTAINVTDSQGSYMLDPAVSSRAAMPPAVPRVGSPPQKTGRYSRVLHGRLLEANSIVDINGTSLVGNDLFGNSTPVKGDLVKGLTDRSCQFISQEGPLFFSCTWSMGVSVHSLDRATLVGKFEHAFPSKKDEGSADIVADAAGQPAARARCNGDMLSTSACLRTKAGQYKEVSFLASLKTLGLVEANAPAETLRYVASSALFAPGDDGRAALLMMENSYNADTAHLIVSDGRTRTFSLSSLPRRFRAAFRSGQARQAWLIGDTVVGFLDAENVGFTRKSVRSGKGAGLPPRKALAFSVGLTGDIRAVEQDGFLGRSGSRILRVNDEGNGLMLSVDLGRTFQPVAPPPGFLIDPNDARIRNRDVCSDAGCQVGTWIRYGWGATSTAPRAP
jgi:hypothetical protein